MGLSLRGDVSSLEPTEWVWSVQRNSCSCVSIVCQLLVWVSQLSLFCVGELRVPICLCWHFDTKDMYDNSFRTVL